MSGLLLPMIQEQGLNTDSRRPPLENETRPSVYGISPNPGPKANAGDGPGSSVEGDGGAAKALPPEVYERLCSTAQVLNLTPEDTLVYAAKHLGQLLLPEQAEQRVSGSQGALPAAGTRPAPEDASGKREGESGPGHQNSTHAQIACDRPAGGTPASPDRPDRNTGLLRPQPSQSPAETCAAGERGVPAAAPSRRRSANGSGRDEFPKTVAFFALLTLLPAAAALLINGMAPRIRHGAAFPARWSAARGDRSHPTAPWMARQIGHAHKRPSFLTTRSEIARRHTTTPQRRLAQHRQLVHRIIDSQPKRVAYRQHPAPRFAAADRVRPVWNHHPAGKGIGWAAREPLVVPSQNEYRPPSAEESFRAALERERLSRQQSAEQFRLAEERERVNRQHSVEQFRLAEERERIERQRSEEQFREATRQEKVRP
jgi:hypothetical protein